MAPRPCLACGTLTTRKPAYCDPCHKTRERERNQTRPHYQGNWQTFSQQLRAQWLANHGPWCPGHHHPPHWVTPRDLTVDHTTPRTHTAGYTILCRSCNSRKQDTPG